jgi:molecular chaperone DnaK
MGKYIIGIDLGTTNSAVAIYENDVPKILENVNGKRTTPSIVAYKNSKDKKTGEVSAEWIIGDSAKRQAVTNPLNTLQGIKRLIGRQFNDDEVTKMKELAPYKIVPAPNGNGDAWVEIDGKAMSPAEISAKVLIELKKAVEKYLGEEVTEAVITVPAYFNDAQRKATRDAGTIAGLDVKRIINEPTAAALAYSMDKKKGGNIIVYDLGGGTFDVSVLEVMVDAVNGNFLQVKSTNGDTFLGGENFDERIIHHLIEVLKEETGIDLKEKTDFTILGRLKEAAEKAKIDLSSQTVSEINLPFLGTDSEGAPVNFEYQLTRTKLEDLVKDLIQKTVEPCKKALADAGLKMSDIDEVILVGGQTRMPKVIETVRTFFGKEPKKDVNPDEIVAMGASVQGAILDGKVENVLLMDVIPLTIGIRLAGDVMSPVIPRNSSIPTEVKDTYSTSENNQRDVEIQLYQGERSKASDNKLLGKFSLDGILPAPKGVPQIEVAFKIDADGVLEVTAKDTITNRTQKITVKANGGLSDDDVARMLKDAQQNAEADRLFKEKQIAGMQADEELKSAKLDENEEYFLTAPEDLKTAFHQMVTELTEARMKGDVTGMTEKLAKLQETRSAIGQAFYAAAGAKQETANDNTPAADKTDAKPPKPAVGG